MFNINKFKKKIIIFLFFFFYINFNINKKYNKNNFKGIIKKLNINIINNNKKIVKNKIFKNLKFIIYHGYTHCPDICIKTLEKLKNFFTKNFFVKKNFIFFSIDNKRDNNEISQKYLIKNKMNNFYAFVNNTYNIEKLSIDLKIIYYFYKNKYNKYKINHGNLLYIYNKYFNLSKIYIKI